MAKDNSVPVVKIALLQASGLTLYISLVGVIFVFGNDWFGPMKNYPLLGPMLFLSLFVVSALVCGLIIFAYPVKLYLEKGPLATSLKLVLYTAAWLVGIVLTLITSLFFLK